MPDLMTECHRAGGVEAMGRKAQLSTIAASFQIKPELLLEEHRPRNAARNNFFQRKSRQVSDPRPSPQR